MKSISKEETGGKLQLTKYMYKMEAVSSSSIFSLYIQVHTITMCMHTSMITMKR